MGEAIVFGEIGGMRLFGLNAGEVTSKFRMPVPERRVFHLDLRLSNISLFFLKESETLTMTTTQQQGKLQGWPHIFATK